MVDEPVPTTTKVIVANCVVPLSVSVVAQAIVAVPPPPEFALPGQSPSPLGLKDPTPTLRCHCSCATGYEIVASALFAPSDDWLENSIERVSVPPTVVLPLVLSPKEASPEAYTVDAVPASGNSMAADHIASVNISFLCTLKTQSFYIPFLYCVIQPLAVYNY